MLTVGRTTDAEQYAYSAVWLVFGVVLLAVGVALKSQAVRLASAAVVILTVLKVFLVDMGDLTGFYQAISFIGLGAVLMGIGTLLPAAAVPAARRDRVSRGDRSYARDVKLSAKSNGARTGAAPSG